MDLEVQWELLKKGWDLRSRKDLKAQSIGAGIPELSAKQGDSLYKFICPPSGRLNRSLPICLTGSTKALVLATVAYFFQF